ncbi:MAG TPA: RHS repeat-associated core domain-containing protein [Clostridia bacterium]|nr:RHS repeat-associated core domain-containing protein [Clostridia bacterium]
MDLKCISQELGAGSWSYLSNLLNQYVDRTVPGTVDVLGLGVPSSVVTVNGNTAARKGEYFHYALSTPNSAAQYTTVSVVSGAESSSGKVFVPQTPEVFAYDLDGNLTSDGRWNYTWDAENRLVKIESLSSAPAGSKRRLEFAYDFMGRRIWKKLTNLDTSAITEERFLYDAWNLVAVLSPSSATILKSFVWGTDLSGSFQGAGGVGGLLKVNQVAAPASSSFVAYDGNGNVGALIEAANGNIAAQYEYGPFGEVIRATGPMAKLNPFRFSTKYQDDETDLAYYGRRYLNAFTGCWLSRDPIAEKGGLNLYWLLANDPVNFVDLHGLKEYVGTAYQDADIAGHAMVEIFGQTYGFGPKDTDANPFWTVGTTETYDGIPDLPRWEDRLFVKKSGKFQDDGKTSCACNATRERILQCANWYKNKWEGSRYTFPNRTCRQYVQAIIVGCCLNNEGAHMNGQ